MSKTSTQFMGISADLTEICINTNVTYQFIYVQQTPERLNYHMSTQLTYACRCTPCRGFIRPAGGTVVLTWGGVSSTSTSVLSLGFNKYFSVFCQRFLNLSSLFVILLTNR